MRLFKSMNQKRSILEDDRKAPRFDAADIPNLRIISDSGGPEAKLINISRSGALIESREHMLPGTCVYLQLAIDENIHYIRGRIINQRSPSTNDRAFEIAIEFDEDFTILPSSTALLED